MAAQTGLLPTPPTPVQINQGLSLWLDEKRGSRQDLRIEHAFEIKRPHLPSSLFKFRCVDDNALRNLRDGTVWLASPDSYNDPFDSMANLSTEDLYRRDLDLLPSRLKESTSAFLSPADWIAIEASESPMQEFSRRMLESDPAIDRTIIPKFLETMDRIGIERTEILFAPLLETIRGSLKICSFSASRDPILMWSHYAGQHQGFCIEYKVVDFPPMAQRLLFPVIYREQMFDATQFHVAASLHPARFNNIYGMLQPLFKAPGWSYEQEWRLVFSAGIFPAPRPYEVGKPTAIYLGARISREDEARLRSICEALSIPVWRMRLARDRYRLEAELAP